MNLTKTNKSSIVAKIMKDIPEVDYAKLVTELVQTEAVKLFPAEVRALYENEETRCYLTTASLHCNSDSMYTTGSIFFPRADKQPSMYTRSIYLTRRHYNSETDALVQKLLEVVWHPVQDMVRKADAQFKERRAMKEKLDTVFRGIRTLKQAKTLLEPELHKYLPVEPPKDNKPAQSSTALVPYVVANLREMGWPKDQEPATKEAV